MLSRNQTNTKWGRRIFLQFNLAEFVFEYFCDSRRILATFAKFCLNSLFATWSYRYPNPKHVIQRALALLSLSYTGFLTQKVFTKYFPFFQLLSQNLAKTLLVLAPDMLFSLEIRRPHKRKKNCEEGEVFVKFCRVKKHVWERIVKG